MNNIAEELGADDVDNYPSESYDLIWTLLAPYEEMTDDTTQECPGLDD